MAADSAGPASISPIRDYESETTHGNERPAKRQKVAAACDQCREKKIKCDGRKPLCRPCERRHGATAHCDWGLRKTRSIGASKLEIMRLRSRIDELERSGRQSNQTRSIARSSTPPLMSDGNHDSDANAMMGLLGEGKPGEGGVVEDSSAASFMNRIKAALDQQPTPNPASQVPSTVSPVATASPRRRRFKTPDYVLPPRHQADHLLEVYWRIVDALYPFVDKDDFMDKYQTLWTGNPSMDDEVCFTCLLNAIFAIACILDSSIHPQDRISSGEVFYKRAVAHFDLEFLQFRSVHTVQCFLLLAQYLQSTSEPQQCWLFTSLAIRIAQSLGLDLPSTSAQTPNGTPNDFLRKVWHGCVLMDRTLAMTLGRPGIITPQAAASVPRPHPHPGSRECSCHRDLCVFEPSAPDLHFFIESLQLYENMSETLAALYSPTSVDASGPEDSYSPYFGGSTGAKAAGTVLEMDSKYWIWRRRLPLHLQYPPDSSFGCTNMIHGRQAKVLYLRDCHIRTLLFRPVLSRFCTASQNDQEFSASEDGLARKLALQCSIMCVKSALDTVDLFGRVHAECRLELLDDLLPAWWYSIFYLYTAATVLVAARLNPAVEAGAGGEEVIMSAARTATAALQRYGRFGKHAKRCAAAIALLFDQIPPRREPLPGAEVQASNENRVTGVTRKQHGGIDGDGNIQRSSVLPADGDITINGDPSRWTFNHDQTHHDSGPRTTGPTTRSASVSANANGHFAAASRNTAAPTVSNSSVAATTTATTTAPAPAPASVPESMTFLLTSTHGVNDTGIFEAHHHHHETAAVMADFDHDFDLNLHLDLGGDMSWLSSIPFDLYG
ncbi:C6 transcription factor [Fonsecaea pedrosoi]|nr:C6 transcription factor [Fonsecaea pedrosoi]